MSYAPSPLHSATFRSRPHRFAAVCTLDGVAVTAHLPNPGRLSEILIPGTPLWLTRSDNPNRKLPWSVFAAERHGAPVCLDTQLANRLAADLIDTDRIPGLEGARVVGREVKRGRSRFDLVIRHGCADRWVEVKSCTLFANRVAAFPDAVTERGRKHLLELSALSTPDNRPIVLWIVHHPDVDWFVPDYHTDLAFSRTFLGARDLIDYRPVAVEWTDGFDAPGPAKPLDVPWEHLEREVRDGGSYVVILRVRERRTIEVGKLGEWTVEPGWYLYVGSAVRGLTARVNRHLRRRKRMRWHIDYLRAAADEVIGLPVRSARREECDLAAAVSDLYPSAREGFGSSDCACLTHLYRSAEDPRADPAFHDTLLRFRLRPPAT